MSDAKRVFVIGGDFCAPREIVAWYWGDCLDQANDLCAFLQQRSDEERDGKFWQVVESV